MISIKTLRKDPQSIIAKLNRRGTDYENEISEILAFDKNQREVMATVETLRHEQKVASKSKPTDEQRERLSKLKNEIDVLHQMLGKYTSAINDRLLSIPNIPDDSAPNGVTENDNICIGIGNSNRNLYPHPLDHVAVGQKHGLDIDTGTMLSGSRFSFLKGPVAKLERVLGQFMLDRVIDSGFLECSPPLIVNTDIMRGTGQLPKFEDDLYKVGDSQYLIPTAEVPLTNSVRDRILASEELPINMTALTPCFRSEAGSAGRDTRGILRQHQFYKVEMVSITRPDQSNDAHEHMLSVAESILNVLGLSYRTVNLCCGDLGFSARKTYDIEVWVPSQKMYREISSISNCGDFQATRMNTRTKIDGKTVPVHTLNGSGLAVGRTLLAILENYQDHGGEVYIPDVLQPMMGRTYL